MIRRYRKSRYTGKEVLGGWVCHPCTRNRIARHLADNPEKRLDVRLWTHYRIRLADYERMLKEQDHKCAACGIPAEECTGNRAWSRLVVDHDHSCCSTRPLCGKCVRGLICGGCNVALGHASDDIERLQQLIAYLKKHKAAL